MRFIRIFCVVLAAAFVSTPLHADTDYKGARWLLDQIQSSRVNIQSNPEIWDERLQQFRQNQSKLTSDQSASQWLQLYRDLFWIKLMAFDYEHRLKKLIAAIPGPQVWPQIYDAAYSRGDEGPAEYFLQYLASLLMKDASGIKEAAMDLLLASDRLPAAVRPDTIEGIEKASMQLKVVTGSVEDQVQAFLKLLELNSSADRITVLDAPDLVVMVGENRAREILRQALTTPGILLDVPAGIRTRNVARELALELADSLPNKQWRLVSDLDSAVALYEAFEKPEPVNVPLSEAIIQKALDVQEESFSLEAQYKQEAKTYYLLALIAGSRFEKAKEVAVELGISGNPQFTSQLVRLLNKRGYQKEIFGFLASLLQENPRLKYWDALIKISSFTAEAAAAENLLKTVVSDPRLSPLERFELNNHLVRFYLAHNLPERALTEFSGEHFIPSAVAIQDLDRYIERWVDRASGFLTAGRLLDRKEWVEAADTELNAIYRHLAAAKPSPHVATTVADNFIAIERYPWAENLLLGLLQNAGQKPDAKNRHDWYIQRALKQIVNLYHKTGRYEDILILVKEYPYWKYDTLNEFIQSYEAGKTEFVYQIAHALHKTGDSDLASAILKSLIARRDDRYDPSYELLIAIHGKDLLPWLDAMAQRNIFEERPLIWKAVVLLGQKKYKAAEAAAKKAIELDPSDGEQPAGYRMKAYAVLGDIKKARRRTKHARQQESIVQAIRQAEAADRFDAAGLTTQAIAMYEDSLRLFSDAYCIHSRLALQLEASGQTEKAQAHFQKAYELMPESFGRRESHCFGCEQVFASQLRQRLAERVFTSELQKTPQHPRLHYLLGYLRLEQDRLDEAYDEFKKSVQLDPQYINAWKKMYEVSGLTYVPLEDQDRIALNLLRLDPFRKVYQLPLNKIWDLATAWQILDHADPSPAEDLLLVFDAARYLEESAKDSDRFSSFEYRAPRLPGEVLADHSLLTAMYPVVGRFSYYNGLQLTSTRRSK